MALANIPRWLEPPDFMSAIHQGSAIGLQRANIQSEADQAANRLGLGYAELAQRARQSQAEMEFAREKSAAEALLHATAEQHLLDYRNKMIEEKQQEETRRAAEALSKHDYFTGKLKVAQDEATRKAKLPTHFAPGSTAVRFDENGNPVEVYKAPANPKNDPTQFKTITEETPEHPATEAVPATPGSVLSSLPLVGRFFDKGTPEIPATPYQPKKVIKTTVRVGSSQALPNPIASPNQNPYPEGTVVYDKQGVKHIVKNGIPVPAENDNPAE